MLVSSGHERHLLMSLSFSYPTIDEHDRAIDVEAIKEEFKSISG